MVLAGSGSDSDGRSHTGSSTANSRLVSSLFIIQMAVVVVDDNVVTKNSRI